MAMPDSPSHAAASSSDMMARARRFSSLSAAVLGLNLAEYGWFGECLRRRES